MSANLIKDQRRCSTEQRRLSRPVFDRSAQTETRRRCSTQSFTDDSEATFIKSAVIGLIILAVFPLILFHVFRFFNPDFLWIPIAPGLSVVATDTDVDQSSTAWQDANASNISSPAPSASVRVPFKHLASRPERNLVASSLNNFL